MPKLVFLNNFVMNTNLCIAFKTDNTIEKLLTRYRINNETITSDKLKKSGVYQLTCKDCNKMYIGQTDSPFRIRFQE